MAVFSMSLCACFEAEGWWMVMCYACEGTITHKTKTNTILCSVMSFWWLGIPFKRWVRLRAGPKKPILGRADLVRKI